MHCILWDHSNQEYRIFLPVSLRKPHYSCFIYVLNQHPKPLFIRIRVIGLVISFIKLIFRCNSHSFTPGFLGYVMNKHLLRLPVFHYCCIFRFIISEILSTLKWSKTETVSVTIPLGIAALFLFIVSSVDLISDPFLHLDFWVFSILNGGKYSRCTFEFFFFLCYYWPFLWLCSAYWFSHCSSC